MCCRWWTITNNENRIQLYSVIRAHTSHVLLTYSNIVKWCSSAELEKNATQSSQTSRFSCQVKFLSFLLARWARVLKSLLPTDMVLYMYNHVVQIISRRTIILYLSKKNVNLFSKARKVCVPMVSWGLFLKAPGNSRAR